MKIWIVSLIVGAGLYGAGCCAMAPKPECHQIETSKGLLVVLKAICEQVAKSRVALDPKLAKNYRITSQDMQENLNIREYVNQAHILLHAEREKILKSHEPLSKQQEVVNEINSVASRSEQLRSLTFVVAEKLAQQSLHEHGNHGAGPSLHPPTHKATADTRDALI